MGNERSDEPRQMLSVEGLNYLVFALVHVTAQRMGPEFMAEVLSFAEQIRGEREVGISIDRDVSREPGSRNG